ncbi:hypothetical protein [Methylobacterium sp. Gmos1]
MTLFDGGPIHKFCLVYCGDDRCNCQKSPRYRDILLREIEPAQATQASKDQPPPTPSPEGEVEGLIRQHVFRDLASPEIISAGIAEAAEHILSRISTSPGDTTGRDPDGSDCRPSDQAPSGLAASGASIPRAGSDTFAPHVRDLDDPRFSAQKAAEIERRFERAFFDAGGFAGTRATYAARVAKPLVLDLIAQARARTPAPAIEARSAETQGGSVEDESAIDEASSEVEAPLPTPSLQTQGAINPPDRREEGSRGDDADDWRTYHNGDDPRPDVEWSGYLPDAADSGPAIAYADETGEPLFVVWWDDFGNGHSRITRWRDLPDYLSASPRPSKKEQGE